MADKTTLRNLRRRLERMELAHLRQHAAELHARLEDAEEAADWWHRHAMDLQDMLNDENYATHRSIGLTQSGELLVVQIDHASTQQEQP